MSDPIDRQAAIDAVKKNTFRLTFAEEQNCEGHVAWSANAVYSDVIEGALLELPSAQPEQSDASEFWRKRADHYSDLCMRLIAEMEKGVKIESVKISENGIEFIKEQPSAQPQYEELTPEEAASEIASGSIISARYWLEAMTRLKQMGYAICREKG